MANIEFKFSIGDKVTINLTGKPGEVIGLSVMKNQTVARVEVKYADNNGLFVEHWFDEDEISAA